MTPCETAQGEAGVGSELQRLVRTQTPSPRRQRAARRRPRSEMQDAGVHRPRPRAGRPSPRPASPFSARVAGRQVRVTGALCPPTAGRRTHSFEGLHFPASGDVPRVHAHGWNRNGEVGPAGAMREPRRASKARPRARAGPSGAAGHASCGVTVLLFRRTARGASAFGGSGSAPRARLQGSIPLPVIPAGIHVPWTRRCDCFGVRPDGLTILKLLGRLPQGRLSESGGTCGLVCLFSACVW